jgi:hypothetical protein
MDSRPGAAHPLLATVRTDAHGAISTVVPRRGDDDKPSIYFLIEKTDDPLFLFIRYFLTQQTWDSRMFQAEVIDVNGNVTSTVPGHFQEVDHDELVTPPSRLRFRLESPGVHVHLRFEYFDREAGAFRPVPPRTIVEAWEDVAGATQPLVRGEVGANGAVELAVPNNNRPQIDLFVRLVMKRTLTSNEDSVSPATVEVRKAGATLRYDTKGNTATDGTAGAFHNVARRVPAAGGPLVFRIGTGAADPNDEASAPFALRVIGEAHDWLRSRSDGDWNGVFGMGVDIVSRPAEGSSFDGPLTAIKVNTAHTIAGQPQPDHWNRRAIVHQYGHLVLETLYGSPLRLSPGVPNHQNLNAATERDRRIAFAEGFSDYLATRHPAAPVAPDPNTPPRLWRGTDGDGANNSGEIVPAAIANALWQVDQNVVGAGHPAITDPVNKRRFQALIWNPLKPLNDADGTRQIAFQLYRAIQAANLAAGDLIAPHSISFVRQLVRTTFEANGLVFTRGQITANPAVVGGRLRFQLAPADRARLNVAEVGAITAYRIQGRRVGGTGVFAETDQFVNVTHANQNETLDLNTVQARETGALDTAGTYDWRVVARDEFGAWDSFADDFTGNGGATATSNDQWQRDRLHSMRGQSVLP